MTNTAMPIPAIIAPASAPSAAPAARQGDAAAPEKPFKQVLTKEIADRRQKTAGKNDSAAPAKQAEPRPEADAPAKSAAANTVSKTGEAEKGNKPDEKQVAEDGSGAAAAIPSALLAMVASLTQKHAAAQAATPSSKDGDAADASDATDPSRLAVDLRAGKGAKTDAQQGEFGADPTAPIAERSGEKLHSPQLGKADIAELRKAAFSDSDSKLARQAADLNTQAAALPPSMPQSAAPLASSALEHLQPAGNRLTPQVGTPAWDQALGQKVVWMVAGAEQSASLSLNPPDLGPLQIVLNISHAQADATFTSAQPEVRQALEAAMPKLRDMLGEAGIQLGQASVNAGTPQQQGEFGRQAPSSSRTASSADEAPASAPVASTRRVSSGIGMVDTFA